MPAGRREQKNEADHATDRYRSLPGPYPCKTCPAPGPPCLGDVMRVFLLLLNMAMFGVFCSVLYLLSPPILAACLGALAAYGLWTLVDTLCERAPRLSRK